MKTMKKMSVLPPALFLLVILFATAQRIPTFASPFKLVFHRLEECPIGLRGKDLFHVTMRSTRYSNKITYYDGNLTLGVDLTADLAWLVGAITEVGRKTRTSLSTYNNICPAFKVIFRPVWVMASMAVYEELYEECLVLKGMYKFQNAYFDNLKLGIVRQFVYGKWRGNVQLLGGDTVLACLRCFADTVSDLNELKTPKHHQQHHRLTKMLD